MKPPEDHLSDEMRRSIDALLAGPAIPDLRRALNGIFARTGSKSAQRRVLEQACSDVLQEHTSAVQRWSVHRSVVLGISNGSDSIRPLRHTAGIAISEFKL